MMIRLEMKNYNTIAAVTYLSPGRPEDVHLQRPQDVP